MTNKMNLYCTELLNDYLGQIIVDLEVESKDEQEAIDALKALPATLVEDLKTRFDTEVGTAELMDIEIMLDESLIFENNLTTGEGENISLGKFTTNQTLLFMLSVKNEMIELMRYIHNDDSSIVKPHWSLPVSGFEFATKLNLEKAKLFFRKYE